MSAQETARAGIATVTAELERRGARVEPGGGTHSKNWLRVWFPDGSARDAYVKTRSTGTWQTDIRKGNPRGEKSDERRFWVFVDLTTDPAGFYIAPEWWVENDIHETYKRDLARFGGIRPRSPSSTHHGIKEERIAAWRDRWDLLGLI